MTAVWVKGEGESDVLVMMQLVFLYACMFTLCFSVCVCVRACMEQMVMIGRVLPRDLGLFQWPVELLL